MEKKINEPLLNKTEQWQRKNDIRKWVDKDFENHVIFLHYFQNKETENRTNILEIKISPVVTVRNLEKVMEICHKVKYQ